MQTTNEELRDRTIEITDLNAFMESILSSLEAAAIVLDRDLVVQVWTPQAQELWGLRHDETVGHHLLNLDSGLPAAELHRWLRPVISGQQTLDAESAPRTGDTPQPLRRALAFIDDHAADPITLNEIAVAAHLSPRGLQATFRRHLDTTPLAQLRSVRMERAHWDLQNAEPGDTSVAALAARWGFTHLGRFAVDYRRRYGSSPSQTLRSSFA
jgi:AraC-like DNA-binding protein